MSAVDPATGQPLPANAIQRVLFVGAKVHVYQIPPLTSTKGYTAATWTEDPKRHIFTARLRVLETGIDTDDDDGGDGDVKVDVVLEDPASGQLFAAAPYTDADAVEPALDSSRFFAVRVQDGQGRRAVLGIGFEERPDAFDFGVALQEARKTAGFAAPPDAAGGGARASSSSSSSSSSSAAFGAAGAPNQKDGAAEKRDYSLKDGETITINLGGSSRFGRRSNAESSAAASSSSTFSLPPPPPPASSSSSSSSSSSFALPPPPPPPRRTANRRSVGDPAALGLDRRVPEPKQEPKKSAAELGFDDGQFGEFA